MPIESPNTANETPSSGITAAAATSGFALAWALTALGPGTTWLAPPVPGLESDPTQKAVQEFFVITESDVKRALADLTAALQARMEPIEPEVREVLYSHLWDLYQS